MPAYSTEHFELKPNKNCDLNKIKTLICNDNMQIFNKDAG